MNEIDFKQWLYKSGYSSKVQSDVMSRIRKVERVLGYIDLDGEYNKDGCISLLSIFTNKGENEDMKKLGSVDLPIGKYQLSTYKYAVSLYIKFLQQKR